MFKRHFMIGLLAVGLVAIFTAEAANAAVGRYRRSVDNFHDCSAGESCYGATSVTDRLYGWDGTNAICEMTGRLFCDPLNNGEICSDAETLAPLVTASFSADATFDVKTAENLTVLDDVTGQAACDLEYPGDPPLTVFNKFWPNQFVAHTIYSFVEGNTYELIEKCLIQTDDPEYLCEKLWDSNSGDSPPHLPCCGVSNTLSVVVNGGGTVTSDDDKINCDTGGTDCEEVYDGTVEPIDACPEVELTATPNYGYEFTGWGGDCDGKGECIVTPPANVTANFELAYGFIKVVVIGGSAEDAKVWIKSPQKANFAYPVPVSDYCYGVCLIDTSDPAFTKDDLILKRAGGTWLEWSGILTCEGDNNSLTTCVIPIDGSKGNEITATWE